MRTRCFGYDAIGPGPGDAADVDTLPTNLSVSSSGHSTSWPGRSCVIISGGSSTYGAAWGWPTRGPPSNSSTRRLVGQCVPDRSAIAAPFSVMLACLHRYPADFRFRLNELGLDHRHWCRQPALRRVRWRAAQCSASRLRSCCSIRWDSACRHSQMTDLSTPVRALSRSGRRASSTCALRLFGWILTTG